MARLDSPVRGGHRPQLPAAPEGVGCEEEPLRPALCGLDIDPDEDADDLPEADTLIVSDIDALKAGFDSGELALDGYLQQLVAARSVEPLPPEMPRPQLDVSPPSPRAGDDCCGDGATRPCNVMGQRFEFLQPRTARAAWPHPPTRLLAGALCALGVAAVVAALWQDPARSPLPPVASMPASASAGLALGIAPPPSHALPRPLASAEAAVPLAAIAAPAPVSPRPAKPTVIGFGAPARLVVPESQGFVLIPVTVEGKLQEAVRLSVQATDGAATLNQDFVPPAASLTLGPGSTGGTVLVSLLQDALPEHVEDFSVHLAVPGAPTGRVRDSVVVIVTDDD